MPSFSGAALGIGGETPFIEKGRQVRRQEKREDLQDDIAKEELGIRKRQVGLQEQGIQQRLAELQRRLAKDQEWKPVGTAKQMKDGKWAQLYFQPETGQTKYEAAPAPEEGQFQTPGGVAGEKAAATKKAEAEALAALRKSGMSDEAIGAAFPQLADKLHYMSTENAGIVGLSTNPYAKPSSVLTPFKGYPPSYAGGTPGSPSDLDETDMGYVDMLGQNRMTLDMLDKLYPGVRLEGKRRMIVAEAIRRGFDPNNQLTAAAGQNVATAQAQVTTNQQLIDKIDKLGLKDNNQLGYLTWSRLKYGAGLNTPGGLADEIANLELTKVTSAANALKGSSRAWAALSLALEHTPNVYKDSPANIRRKLETINQRLNEVIAEQRRFGTKSGLPQSQGGGQINMKGVTGTIELPGGKKTDLGGPLPQPVAPVRTNDAQPPI